MVILTSEIIHRFWALFFARVLRFVPSRGIRFNAGVIVALVIGLFRLTMGLTAIQTFVLPGRALRAGTVGARVVYIARFLGTVGRTSLHRRIGTLRIEDALFVFTGIRVFRRLRALLFTILFGMKTTGVLRLNTILVLTGPVYLCRSFTGRIAAI